MAKTITINIEHGLGVEPAKRRIAERLTQLQRDYVAKIGHSDIAWSGDVANISVSALGQRANAQVTVLADLVRVDIQLPLLLSGLSGKVQEFVSHNADQILKIGHRTG